MKMNNKLSIKNRLLLLLALPTFLLMMALFVLYK